jgi:hypothetical protein
MILNAKLQRSKDAKHLIQMSAEKELTQQRHGQITNANE